MPLWNFKRDKNSRWLRWWGALVERLVIAIPWIESLLAKLPGSKNSADIQSPAEVAVASEGKGVELADILPDEPGGLDAEKVLTISRDEDTDQQRENLFDDQILTVLQDGERETNGEVTGLEEQTEEPPVGSQTSPDSSSDELEAPSAEHPADEPTTLPLIIDFAAMQEMQVTAIAKLKKGADIFRQWREETGYPPLTLFRTKLSRLMLESTDWRNCTLIEVDFTGANLAHSSFEHAVVRACKFTDAQLGNAMLEGLDLSELVDISPQAVAEHTYLLSGAPWDRPSIPFAVRLAGRAKRKSSFTLRQRVEIRNDSSQRLRFELMIFEGMDECECFIRYVEPRSRSTFLLETAKLLEINNAALVVQTYSDEQGSTSFLSRTFIPLN